MKEQRHIWVSGRVQGVGFRWYTQKRAQEFGIFGTVKNLSDGRVEIVAEGELSPLNLFEAAVRKGPNFSAVEHVLVEKKEIFDYSWNYFEITF